MHVSPQPIHPSSTQSRSERLANAYHASKSAPVRRQKTKKLIKEDLTTYLGQDSIGRSEEWDMLQKWIINNIDSVQNLDMHRRDNYLEEMRLEMLDKFNHIQTEEVEYSLELILQVLLDIVAGSKLKDSVFLGVVIQWIIKYYDEQNVLYRQQFIDVLGKNIPVLAKRVSKERIQNLIFKLLEEYEDAPEERKDILRNFFKKITDNGQLRKLYQKVLTSYREVVRPKELRVAPYKPDDIDAEVESDEDRVRTDSGNNTIIDEFDPMGLVTELTLFKQPIPYRVIRKQNEGIHTLGIAFVVHASTTLARTQASYSDLDIFRLPRHESREKLMVFWARLKRQGFTKIVVLLPSKARFKDDFEAIQDTCTELCECIDTYSYGVGIGLILQYAIAYCRQKKRQPDTTNWLDPALKRLKHWVINLQSEEEKKKDWITDAERTVFPEHSRRMVLELNQNAEAIGFFESLSQSLDLVDDSIAHAIEASPYRIVVIIHNTTFKDVITAYAYQIRKKYPKLAVYLKHRSRRQLDFGVHISVAML